MSHVHITILYLFWQQKQKIRRWEQLNCEFSCIKAQCKRWWKTEVLLAETLQSNQALSVILLLDVNSDAKLLLTKEEEEEEILPFPACGQRSSRNVKTVDTLVDLVWIKCVSDTFPETIHTRIGCTQCRTALCHARSTYTDENTTHTESSAF